MKPNIPLYKKSWKRLTPRQKLLRTKSLSVLNVLRKSKSESLRNTANQNGIAPSTVIHHTNGFKKVMAD